MDAVKAFNAEMASLLDMKPPISRAKMMSVTKAGMKAIKLYKHVVQITEKFIKKCNPELKVPGLYVVDSIIRQSRHQFGEDKDVFGPRFLKNISSTFQSLYECPPDDKDKILRVLSLWQKNSVFSMDVIQPLVDAASTTVMSVLENGNAVEGSPIEAVYVEPTPEPSTTSVPQNSADQQNNVTLAAVTQFLQSAQSFDLQQILQTLQQGVATQANIANAGSTLNAAPAHQNSSLSQVLQERFSYDEEPNMEQPQLMEMCSVSSTNLPTLQQAVQGQLNQLSTQALPHASPEQQVCNPDTRDACAVPEPHMAESGPSWREDPDRRYNRRSRSRSPRRRSLSSSRFHSRHSRYRRSRSRERRRSPQRSRIEDRREMERRLKGLPPIKREMLSVCSTTLWLGQLDKKTLQQDVSSLIEEFGQVESINMIPPRGCAYISMVHRQDAYMALNKLSRGSVKINNKSFKIAWAMNKGVSGRFKKCWNAELGVTYIPWARLKEAELVALREGAVFDQETLKPEWASMLDELVKPVRDCTQGPEQELEGGAAVASQVPAGSTESNIDQPNTVPAIPVVETPSNHSNSSPPRQIRPLLLNPLPHPPLMSLLSNILHPAPKLPQPNMPRAPMFRNRFPTSGPNEDFPRIRIMESARWSDGPFRDDWHDSGPPRGPSEWFGPGPTVRHRGWIRGGRMRRRQFRN